MAPATTSDRTDHALLAQLRQPLPIDHRPFQVLGEKLGLSEQACLERLERLKAQGAIQFISGAPDAGALGYAVTLLAMRVPEERVPRAMDAFRRYPGTAHLHRLDDPGFNVWGTLVLSAKQSPQTFLRVLHDLAEAEETVALPVVRRYKGMRPQDELEEECWLRRPEAGDPEETAGGRRASPELTDRDVALLRIAQEEFPLLEIPYAVWAEQADGSEEELLDWLKRMEHLGVMPGVVARVSPQALTALTHVTIAWRSPLGRVDVLGDQMAAFREVAYCYRRPLHPHWPYPLFTVVRAAGAAACLEVAQRLNDTLGPFPHKPLVSVEEAPLPGRVKLFSPAFDVWWREQP